MAKDRNLVCHPFAQTGTCERANCIFVHRQYTRQEKQDKGERLRSKSVDKDGKQRVCNLFQQGRCYLNSFCPFKHGDKPKPKPKAKGKAKAKAKAKANAAPAAEQ